MCATRARVLDALAGGEPRSCREIIRVTGLGKDQVYKAVYRAWRSGYLFRTREPRTEWEHVNDGKAGKRPGHLRPYHLYVLKPEGLDELKISGEQYVGFSEEFIDPRGGGSVSKASRVVDYLRMHPDMAFFSTDIAEALEEHGVLIRDVMPAVRRLEKRGRVYVRGYKTDMGQSPFARGYLLTWLDAGLARERAIMEAIRRTDDRLMGESAVSPALERVHRIRDIILEHSRLRQLVGTSYMIKELGCTREELDYGLGRVLTLYNDLRELKLFDAYRYYHDTSLAGAELDAAVEMKKNYVRIAKGRANRVGHNWEAVAEWFIDEFTEGAKFWEQQHRTSGFDRRRITLYLVKGVGTRRRYAEVDRIWDVTPGVFAPTITYVLSCKWGIVRKSHVDDFLEVLRWSKEFGVDTPDGREVKQ